MTATSSTVPHSDATRRTSHAHVLRPDQGSADDLSQPSGVLRGDLAVHVEVLRHLTMPKLISNLSGALIRTYHHASPWLLRTMLGHGTWGSHKDHKDTGHHVDVSIQLGGENQCMTTTTVRTPL